MSERKLTVLGLFSVGLAACGPSYAPPDAPARACPQISAAEYEAAIAAGAASATATIAEDGVVSIRTGPGVVHCATYASAMRPCRRPNDFVIKYQLSDGEVVYNLVPAGKQYRFRAAAQPTSCEIVNED
jgi:hypothetical protein